MFAGVILCATVVSGVRRDLGEASFAEGFPHHKGTGRGATPLGLTSWRLTANTTFNGWPENRWQPSPTWNIKRLIFSNGGESDIAQEIHADGPEGCDVIQSSNPHDAWLQKSRIAFSEPNGTAVWRDWDEQQVKRTGIWWIGLECKTPINPRNIWIQQGCYKGIPYRRVEALHVQKKNGDIWETVSTHTFSHSKPCNDALEKVYDRAASVSWRLEASTTFNGWPESRWQPSPTWNINRLIFSNGGESEIPQEIHVDGPEGCDVIQSSNPHEVWLQKSRIAFSEPNGTAVWRDWDEQQVRRTGTWWIGLECKTPINPRNIWIQQGCYKGIPYRRVEALHVQKRNGDIWETVSTHTFSHSKPCNDALEKVYDRAGSVSWRLEANTTFNGWPESRWQPSPTWNIKRLIFSNGGESEIAQEIHADGPEGCDVIQSSNPREVWLQKSRIAFSEPNGTWVSRDWDEQQVKRTGTWWIGLECKTPINPRNIWIQQLCYKKIPYHRVEALHVQKRNGDIWETVSTHTFSHSKPCNDALEKVYESANA